MTVPAALSESPSFECRLTAIAERSERLARSFEEVGVSTETTNEQSQALFWGKDRGPFVRAKSEAAELRHAFDQEGFPEYVRYLDVALLEPFKYRDCIEVEERWRRAVLEAPAHLRSMARTVRDGLAAPLPENEYPIPVLGDGELAAQAANLAAEIWRVRCYWEVALDRRLPKQVIARRLSIDPEGPVHGPAVDLTIRGAESVRYIHDWLSTNRGADAGRMFCEKVLLPLESFDKESWKCLGAKDVIDARLSKEWPSQAAVNGLRDASRNLKLILQAQCRPAARNLQGSDSKSVEQESDRAPELRPWRKPEDLASQFQSRGFSEDHREVVRALQGGAASIKSVASAVSWEREKAARILADLARWGLVKREGRGPYQLTSEARLPA